MGTVRYKPKEENIKKLKAFLKDERVQRNSVPQQKR